MFSENQPARYTRVSFGGGGKLKASWPGGRLKASCPGGRLKASYVPPPQVVPPHFLKDLNFNPMTSFIRGIQCISE